MQFNKSIKSEFELHISKKTPFYFMQEK